MYPIPDFKAARRCALMGLVGIFVVVGHAPVRADEPAPAAARLQEVHFSPYASALEGAGSAARTNAALTASTDPRFPGAVVVAFPRGTQLTISDFCLGGNPTLGLDPAAIQWTHEVPGVGQVHVPSRAVVQRRFLVLRPLPPFARQRADGSFQVALPAGQHTVSLYRWAQDAGGHAAKRAAVIHSFHVDSVDKTTPRVLSTIPVNGQLGVPWGLPVQTITIRLSEPIDPRSVGANTVVVTDAGAFPEPVQLPAAPGYPRLRRGSAGHEIVWRPDPSSGGFAAGTDIRVRVHGADTLRGAIHDLAGNAMARSFSFTFPTRRPPTLPAALTPEAEIKRLQSQLKALEGRLQALLRDLAKARAK